MYRFIHTHTHTHTPYSVPIVSIFRQVLTTSLHVITYERVCKSGDNTGQKKTHSTVGSEAESKHIHLRQITEILETKSQVIQYSYNDDLTS